MDNSATVFKTLHRQLISFLFLFFCPDCFQHKCPSLHKTASDSYYLAGKHLPGHHSENAALAAITFPGTACTSKMTRRPLAGSLPHQPQTTIMSTIHRSDMIVLLANPPMTRTLPPFSLTKVFYHDKTTSPQTTESGFWSTFLEILHLLTDISVSFAELCVAVKDCIHAYNELKEVFNSKEPNPQRRDSHRRYSHSSNQQSSVMVIDNISTSSQPDPIFASCPYRCRTSISCCRRCEAAARWL